MQIYVCTYADQEQLCFVFNYFFYLTSVWHLFISLRYDIHVTEWRNFTQMTHSETSASVKKCLYSVINQS